MGTEERAGGSSAEAGTNDDDGHSRLRPLFCGRAQRRGGAHSVVDYALGISAAILRSASDARCGDRVDRRGFTRLFTRLRALPCKGSARRRRSHRRKTLW